MKKKSTFFTGALLLLSSFLSAQTTYNFANYPTTGYAYGANPTDISCTDVSTASTGYWKVSASASDANIKVLNVGSYTVSGSSSIVTGDLTKFPSAATNYSVIAKRITTSTLTKWGFVLRGQSTSKNYPGTASGTYSNLRDGVLFQINENNATSATVTIRKPASSTSFSNLTNTSINSTTFTYTANSALWYKAEASGSNYTFSWSTDSLTWNVAYSGVDATNTSGSTQIWSGLGNNASTLQLQYITYQPITILPVTLSSFKGKAEQNQVLLNWQTLTESSNSGFDVERSADGKTFTKVSFVPGKGSANFYSFTDATPQSGKSYYRLKQIDSDGNYTFSEVISINTGITSALKVFPNPTSNILNFSSYENGSVLTISNTLGQILVKKALTGPEVAQVNVSSFPSGLYIYKLNNVKGTFIKQ